MKDLNRIAATVRADLDSLGIQYRSVRNLTVNARAKKRWGECRRISEGVFDISISEQLLADEVDDFSVKSTMCHELLHTVDGCFGHRGKWKELADLVNESIPGYDVHRVSRPEDKGIITENKPLSYKYAVVCSGCGKQILRKKASALVKQPTKYRCGICGVRFRVHLIT